MANFGIKPDFGNDPDYSRNSRLDSSAFENSGAMLDAHNQKDRFRDLFNLFDTTAKAVTSTVDETLQSMMQPQVDKARTQNTAANLNDLYGKPETLDQAVAGHPNGDALSRSIGRLATAKEQGKFPSDMQYYAQLETIVRAAKARFPGYEGHVDKMMQELAGVTPANALRASVENELEKAQSSSRSEAEYKEKFIMQRIEDAPANWREMKPDAVIDAIQKRLVHKANLDIQSKELSVKKAKGDVDHEQMLYKGSQIIQADLEDIDRKNMPTIDLAIQAAKVNKLLPREEAMHIANDYRRNVEKSLFDRMSKMNLSPTEVAQYKAMGEAKIKQFEDLLYKGEYSIAEINGKIVKDQDYAFARDVNEKTNLGKGLKWLAGLGSVGQALIGETRNDFIPAGTEFMKELYKVGGKDSPETSETGKVVPPEAAAAADSLKIVNSLPKESGVTPGTPMEQVQKVLGKTASGRAPATLERYVNDWKDILTNPKMPEEWRKQAFERFFSKDNKAFLTVFTDSASKEMAYSMFTSKPVMEMAMKYKGTPPYNLYSNWVKTNMKYVFKDEIDELKAIGDRPYARLVYNPENQTFHVEPTPEGEQAVKEIAARTGQAYLLRDMLYSVEKLYEKPLRAATDRLNRAIENTKPLMEGEKYNFSDQIRNLIAYEANNEKKNHTFWSSVLRYFVNPTEVEGKSGADLTFGGVPIPFSDARGGGVISSPALDAIKASFSKGESGNNYNRLVNKTGDSSAHEAPLTNMTVREVLAYQGGMKAAGHPTTAAGKYQIVRGTLQGLVDNGVLKLDDKFDEASQEKAATALMEGRGLRDYLEGRKPLSWFMDNLSKEWEILQKDPGAYKMTMNAVKQLREKK